MNRHRLKRSSRVGTVHETRDASLVFHLLRMCTKITQACLNRDPRKRPNFEELVRSIVFCTVITIMAMCRRKHLEGYRTVVPCISTRSIIRQLMYLELSHASH